MTRNRKVMEYTTAPEPESSSKKSERDNLTMEHLIGISLTINGSDIKTQTKLDEEGRIKKITPEYLFMKGLCGNCPNKLLEEADPRTIRWSEWEMGVKGVSDNRKYKKFFDKRDGNYYTPMIRRDLSQVFPVEFLCNDCIDTDPMQPGEKVLKDRDLLTCDRNIPKGYKNCREYFLAFKKNFIFFSNLLPIELKDISEEQYKLLSKFGKYAFESVKVSLKSLGIYPEYTIALHKVDELPLPPVLEGKTVDITGGFITYDNWIDYTHLNQVINDIYNSLEAKDEINPGTYYYNIDNMVILKVNIEVEKDAFKGVDTYSLIPVVVDANANTVDCGVDEEGKFWSKEKEDRSDQRSETDPIDSYRFVVEFIQICD